MKVLKALKKTEVFIFKGVNAMIDYKVRVKGNKTFFVIVNDLKEAREMAAEHAKMKNVTMEILKKYGRGYTLIETIDKFEKTNNEWLQRIADRLSMLDYADMTEICRKNEATIYTIEDLKNVTKMQYIIEWLLDKID